MANRVRMFEKTFRVDGKKYKVVVSSACGMCEYVSRTMIESERHLAMHIFADGPWRTVA